MLSYLLTVLALWSSTGSDVAAFPVLTDVTHHFEHQGIEVREIRTLDPRTGLIRREAYDAAGAAVDLDALRMKEQELKIAARGKISPELGERIASVAAKEVLPVAFWLAVENEPDFRGIINRLTAQGVHGEEARRQALAEGKRFFSPLTNAFADRLGARGIPVEYVGTSWPIVIASVPASDIPDLAMSVDVDQAYYAFPAWEHENNYAQPTLRTPTVHRRGNKGGAGAVKVMVQDSGGNVVTNNPYLPPVIKLNADATDYHATGVAGNICMQNHPFYHGGAPALAELYTAAGWGDVDAPAAWDLGMQAGVSYGNCSWWNLTKGSIVFLDRYFDYIIRNYAVMMFKSNGNQGTTSEPYATSPGNGYNMTCTGCYNDGDTFKWNDDQMASYSSWWNPVEGHEKPEVASPGDDVTTTGTSSPWLYNGFGGTSSASPLTMGVATLVANRAPSIITHSQAIKAILMVSAWHNIEGNEVLSDKDGAGGVHAGAADAVARDGQFEVGDFTSASFPYDKTILCYQGDGTRVICLWQSDPDSAYATDVLKMDLDITVLDPDSNVVASSANTKNAFELVYFIPPKTGVYTIRLTKQTFLGTSEPYCIAWSTQQDTATLDIQLVGTGQIGTTMEFAFYAPHEFSENYGALLSLGTLPDLIPLGNGYILPVAWDFLAHASLYGMIPGCFGQLSGGGQASVYLTIPYANSLIGMDIYCAGVTLDANARVREVSEAATFTIQ